MGLARVPSYATSRPRPLGRVGTPQIPPIIEAVVPATDADTVLAAPVPSFTPPTSPRRRSSSREAADDTSGRAAPDRRRAPGARRLSGRPDSGVGAPRLGRGAGPPGPDRPAGGAKPNARARLGPGSARPDDGLAVHVLPRRREDHGGRPRGNPHGRPHRPALRRRAPVELRWVRLAGAAPALRRQRLRRDAARPVRVRRQAARGELHDRGAEQRVREGRHEGGHADVRRGVPRGDARLRADAHAGCVVRQPLGGRRPRRRDGEREGATTSARRSKRGERSIEKARTRDSVQALSKLAERVDGTVPHRQSAAARGAVARAGDQPRRVAGEVEPRPRAVPRLSPDAPGRPAAAARPVPGGGHGPQGRRRRQRRYLGVHRAAAGPRRPGPAVPPGQAGDGVGAGGPPAEEPVPRSTASASCRVSG